MKRFIQINRYRPIRFLDETVWLSSGSVADEASCVIARSGRCTASLSDEAIPKVNVQMYLGDCFGAAMRRIATHSQ